MLILLIWVIYGLIVGVIAQAVVSLFMEAEIQNRWQTIVIGIAGSYIGGFIEYVLNGFRDEFTPAGIVSGIIGAVVALVGLRYFNNWKKNQ
jgi:uncharacterized membrane protein YeaQ/YmgE (transglycosylase-associated protein family)